MDRKATIREMLDAVWNRHDPVAAGACFREDYTEHNPMCPPGRAGFVEAVQYVLAESPDTSLTFQRIVEDGDIVIAHVHWKRSVDDPGFAAVDIFRFEGDEVVEHWDVLQQVPGPDGKIPWMDDAVAINPNGMF